MNQRVASPSSAHIDLVGTCLSLGCAIHCLSVPVLVSVLPLAGAEVLLGRSLEVLFILTSVLGAALTLIGVGRFLASGPSEVVCVVVGAIVLAGSIFCTAICV
jgi:hypothetical protein